MQNAMTIPIEKIDAPGFRPDEAWIEAFATQFTDELREDAKRYAIRRLRGVGKVGGAVDDLDARALVQDAMTDTLLGEVTWEPSNNSLEHHLEDVMRYWTRDLYVRAKRHRRIDAFDRSDAASATMAAVDNMLQNAACLASVDELLDAELVVSQLREVAKTRRRDLEPARRDFRWRHDAGGARRAQWAVAQAMPKCT